MEQSRVKTGKALNCLGVPLILWLIEPLILQDNLVYVTAAQFVLLLLLYFPYRYSKAGGYAIAGICNLLAYGCNVLLYYFSFTGSVAAGMTVFSAICSAGTLWFLSGATAAVLRSSRNAQLAKWCRIPQGVALLSGGAAAVRYLLQMAGSSAEASILFTLCTTAALLSALIYLGFSTHYLTHVTEIDPKKVEEMRNRLQ